MCESSASFLPSVVACATSQCEAVKSDLDLFLGPLQLYCNAIDCAIPDQVINRAYTVVKYNDDKPNDDDGESSATWDVSTTIPIRTPAPTAPYRGHNSESKSKSTRGTTLIQPTTDSDGGAPQIVVLYSTIIGSTTDPIIHTRTHEAIRTMSATATMSATSALTPVAATNLRVASEPKPSPTSAETPLASSSPKIGNGTPFDNMQAVAGNWYVPVPLLCLAAVACLFARL